MNQMIDMHYDLLSILYYCYLKKDFSYINKISAYYNENNITGVIANLYFMSPKEMQKELGVFYTSNIDVPKIFAISTKLFKKFFPQLKAVFSIEGCDYIKNTQELEILYNLGLRNILLVWNNPNKYGSGIKSNNGLSTDGTFFLKKAIELGITIDLSHMNQNTFYDTVTILKEQKKLGKKVKVIVSHSNYYNLYNHPRNINNAQIKSLKELNPIIGLVSYKKFISNSTNNKILKEKYLEHINSIIELLGINSIGISTDDMTYANHLLNKKYTSLFNYKTIKEELTQLLSTKYTTQEIEQILHNNIYQKLFL